MSLAGVRSFRGDEYQFQVAVEWMIRLLTDDDVVSVQAESLGAIGEAPPSVDDVVVRLEDKTVYIQAKKNHPKRETWSLEDDVLCAEVKKARDQLEEDSRGEAWFYSQSPFGRFAQLCDESRYFPDYSSFVAKAPKTTLKKTLATLAGEIDRDLPTAFGLVRRMRTKSTPDFDDWERAVLRDLRARFARADDVADFLVRLIARQHARLGGSVLLDPTAPVTRADLEAALRKRGYVRTPDRPEQEMLDAFAQASLRGRTWKRDVDGETFARSEVDEVLAAVHDGSSVVVTSAQGVGKTCVLLEVVDRLEADNDWVVLFIKGDQYGGARTLSDLTSLGLPTDIVGQASRLSVGRRVAVVLDALDVLSLQRASGTLALFLGLLDELAAVEGVVVVAACRDFDLGYAPELRNREWGQRVRVGPLSQETVGGVLQRWGLTPVLLNATLREHLRVPQHLRLFGQLVRGGVTDVGAGPYALHDRFLDVIVEGNADLGAAAMEALYGMADRLQTERQLTLPRSAFPGDPALADRLLSAEVLTEVRPGVLSFSHQELLDCVAVRGAVRTGETLVSYLTARPALPFLRPTARTFLFMLRAQDSERFRRQVRQALGADHLAYHLRRLIAESLAEIQPEERDRRLLQFLMRSHPDLFERFAARLSDWHWLEHVVALLHEARGGPNAERWTPRLLLLLNTWAHSEPETVVGLWVTALSESWPGTGSDSFWGASKAAQSALRHVPEEIETPPEVGDLIRLILDLPDPERHYAYDAPRLVQTWVEAVDGDDDLVQRVLERDRGVGENDRVSRDFQGAFMEDRLSVSDALMDWAYDELKRTAVEDELPRWSHLLHATSYRSRHSRGMMAGGDGRNVLVEPFERALIRRAERGDAWWMRHEGGLRGHSDWGFRYLAMQGYMAAPESHARTIALFVSDPEVLGFWSMKSEVRELAYIAYPFFTDDERSAHQRAVLALAEPDNDGETWRERNTYGRLIWVPGLWRAPEAQKFVETWETTFGPWKPEPDITSSGGMVGPPFGTDQLLALSDEGMVRMALRIGTDLDRGGLGAHDHVGGWDQAVGVYRGAASRAPSRMASVLPLLIEHDAAPPYLDAVVDGLGTFLRLRFGNLSTSSWSASEEHEDGEALGQHVLRLIERFGDRGFREGYAQAPTWKEYGAPWLSEHTASDAMRGCEAVLVDGDDLARLTLILVRLARSENPKPDRTGGAASVGLNSVRGEVAETAISIAGSRAANGAPSPALLRPLLLQLASDPVPGVRWSILGGLPYFTQFDGEFGWTLAERALEEHNPELWQQAERLLYHNYYRDFARVAPFLSALGDSEATPATYGRIGMLSALAGHLDPDGFVDGLRAQPDEAWKGTAQVLVANLRSDTSRQTCVRLLDHLLSSEHVPAVAVQSVAHGLTDEVRPYVPRSIVEKLIAARDDEDGFRWTRIAEWIEAESAHDPSSAADVLGQMADAVREHSARGFYGSRAELGRALNSILREADESDDASFIQTAVGLQDTLTLRGFIDADAMFEASARQ